jgi:periplasmic protein TonB
MRLACNQRGWLLAAGVLSLGAHLVLVALLGSWLDRREPALQSPPILVHLVPAAPIAQRAHPVEPPVRQALPDPKPKVPKAAAKRPPPVVHPPAAVVEPPPAPSAEVRLAASLDPLQADVLAPAGVPLAPPDAGPPPAQSPPGVDTARTPGAAETVVAGAQAPADGPVTAPDFTAAFLGNHPARYPPEAAREHEEGTVLVRVRVNAAGRLERAEIRRSSGFRRLDESALATVREWAFIPAKRAGQPIPYSLVIPIQYRLED